TDSNSNGLVCFFQAEDGIRIRNVTGVQTCALPIYITVNILPHNEDLIGLDEYIKKLIEIGVDALIVSDPGIYSIIREIDEEIEEIGRASCREREKRSVRSTAQ